MGKGTPWSREQELQLRELVKAGKTVEELAAELKKSPGAIKLKLRRLGLEVVVPDEKKTGGTTSTSFHLVIPADLPSVEYQLRKLAGAIDALEKGNLDKVDVMRLGRLIAGVEKNSAMYAAYVGYREIEQKVDYAIEWMKKRDEEHKNLDRLKST